MACVEKNSTTSGGPGNPGISGSESRYRASASHAHPDPGAEEALASFSGEKDGDENRDPEQGHGHEPGRSRRRRWFGGRRSSRSPSCPREPWWRIHFFQGMINDVRKRAPYYLSDWTDAWNYRVVPATVYMFFANILPALAFSLDMFNKTDMNYGVNEVLLASVLGAVVFSFFACQPLVIVGVTGPITVFNYTVYDIMAPRGTNYLAFMCWIGLWSLVFHWILAITNSCNWLRYVTRFPCDIFGFYVAFIYLQKGIQILTPLGNEEPFYLSVALALLVFAIAYACGEIGKSTLFHHHIRVFIKDYGTPLTLVFFTAFVHIGRMRQVKVETLPTGISFEPTVTERGWFIHFWDIPVGDIFLAIPFALLLTILFWFDHNVSSLIAQGTEFPLKKPAGFHWDLFLLGATTGVAGLLGLPFPNGLIPQAPFHTNSLCVTEHIKVKSSSSTDKEDLSPTDDDDGDAKYELRASYVVEQRVSNLAQGLLTLGTMSGPLLKVLHLVPQGVLAGLFFIMGFQALEGNGITAKLLFLARDRRLTPRSHPLLRCPRAKLWLFVIVELIGFGATFAITQTVAAVGFPVFIFALIPVRALLLPKWLTPQELALLDEPTASPFTMESVGGTWGAAGSVKDAIAGVADAGSGVILEAQRGTESSSGEDGAEELGELARRVSSRRSQNRKEKEERAVADVELAERGESRSGSVRRRLSVANRTAGDPA